jgi:hypothetical protein
MPGKRIEEIRECYQQAVLCVQQAEAQNNPKVKKQFLDYAALAVIGAQLRRVR